MIQIQKGIPTPSKRTFGDKWPSLYPFRVMDVGDSFTVEATIVQANALRSLTSSTAKRHGLKFSTRYEDGHMTVWRTA